MIVKWTDDGWKREERLLDALNLSKEEGPRVISLVGAGGKTTVVRRFREECLGAGISHVMTTTTHMQFEKTEDFLSEASLEQVMEMVGRFGTVWLGEPVSEGKMRGVSVDFLRRIADGGLWLFVEADGAKRLPVKAPDVHEPVVVPFSTDVLAVYGLDAVGRPIEEVCFRVDKVTALLGKTVADRLTAVDIVRLAASTAGGRKQVSDGMRYGVILNKADTPERLFVAAEIARGLQAAGIETILATADLIPEHGRKYAVRQENRYREM